MKPHTILIRMKHRFQRRIYKALEPVLDCKWKVLNFGLNFRGSIAVEPCFRKTEYNRLH